MGWRGRALLPFSALALQKVCAGGIFLLPACAPTCAPVVSITGAPQNGCAGSIIFSITYKINMNLSHMIGAVHVIEPLVVFVSHTNRNKN